VGPPIPNVEIRIADDGEILARGPNVMMGYYKNPEATEETIVDGWFHTGDIGELDGDGCLRITDRKKDIIVTSGGKNVAPQPIENSLKLSPLIEQAVLIGDQRKFISALIIPPWETVEKWAPLYAWPSEIATLVNHEGFRKGIEKEIERFSKDFSRFERVKKFEVLPDLLTLEKGELTPSLKVKRKVVVDHYKTIIEGIYEGT